MAKKLEEASIEGEVRSRVLSLPKRFRKDAADGLSAEWELTVGREVYTISVIDRRCFTREGPSLAPASRLTADPQTWLAIDDGALTGPEAFLERRIAVRGNLDLAVRLETLFQPRLRKRGPADLDEVDIQANGVRLSAYVAGRGSPVLLLHGLGGTKVSWLPTISALAPHYRVVVPDMPGHGESDKPHTDYTARFFARAIRKMMETLGIERAAVVGNSMGGRVALEMAVRSPDRVSGVAVLGPAVPGFRVRYVMGFTRVIPSEIGRIPFPLRERWMQVAIRRLFAEPERLPADGYAAAADEFIRIYRSAPARMALLDSLRHLLTEPPKPFFERMRRVRVPALVMWGEEDRLVPVRLAAKLAGALPNAELIVMPHVGHVPQFEVPAETNAALLSFLQKLD